MREFISRAWRRVFLLGGLLLAASTKLAAQSDQTIYTDSLQNGWQNWGRATLNYDNAGPVHSGSKPISVTITDSAYHALHIHHTALDTSPHTNLVFWLHGGATGGNGRRTCPVVQSASFVGRTRRIKTAS